MKRNIDLIDNTNNNYDKLKKQKLNISNDLGLLSPPTTPENQLKTVAIKNSNLSSVSKNLNNKLFSINDDINNSNNNNNSNISPYSIAKKLFQKNSKPIINKKFILNGRENEAKILNTYILNSLKNLESNSIYVSGPPGTGKSAQINATINYLLSLSISNNNNIYSINLNNEIRKIRIIKFNCMSISNSTDLFKELYFKISGLKYKPSDGSNQLFDLLKKNNNSNNNNCDMTILVLDEMDNIINKYQQSLFELFTHASNKLNNDNNKSNLLLIGIANALNLTDRFLPRLRANCINPKLIQFLPYTSDQINNVITCKLLNLLNNDDDDNDDDINENTENKENNSSLPILPPLAHPAAIKFCSKKSATTTGDLRKAFDVMHKSFDLFEQNILKSNSIDELNKIPIEKLPKLMITQVVKVCSKSFNSNFDLKLKPLNLQKKIILAFLFKFEEKLETENSKNLFINKDKKLTSIDNNNKNNNKNNDVSINSFFNYYTIKCKTFDGVITQLKRSEFLEIITSLDIHGLVTISMVNTSSLTKNLISNNNGITLNFDNYKVIANIPKLEFFKNVNDNIILKKIIYSNY